MPWANAARAAAARASPARPGSRPAAAGAPPSVSRAAAGAVSGTPWRWTAVPMEPRTAVPSAPPNSAPVSLREEAEPARSTGAAPSARSVIRDTTMVTPEARTPQPASTSTSASVSTSISGTKPRAAVTKPAVTTWARPPPAGSPRGSAG